LGSELGLSVIVILNLFLDKVHWLWLCLYCVGFFRCSCKWI